MICRLCGNNQTALIGNLPFYMEGKDVITEIYKCNSCGCYWRNFLNLCKFEEHFEIASYTNIELESKWWLKRHLYFQNLAQLIISCSDSNWKRMNVLDVGCSYGHFMEILSKSGYKCSGVEIVDHLRKSLEKKGKFTLYKNIFEIPKKLKFDVITLIDSLYYFDDPVSALHSLNKLLNPTGIMVIRISNRTTILNFYSLFLKNRISNKIFGDQLFAFSDKSIKLMLKKCDLTIQFFFLKEPGKQSHESWLVNLYYNITPFFSNITGIKLSPGIIYICKKNSEPLTTEHAI